MRVSLQERFIAKVDRSGDCWLWTAGRYSEGYGKIQVDGQSRLAHRIAYELFIGPIPEGLELDHLCRIRHCVNPGHLEPVTHQANLLRSPIAPAALHARRTHCLRGHLLDGVQSNSGHTTSNRARYCKTCRRQNRHARRLALKGALA